MYQRFGLVLMVSHACNLRCQYCYAGAKVDRPMPPEVGRKAIDRATNSVESGGTLALGFFGGEPLLELERIVGFIDHARRATAARNIHLKLSLTTNGTIVDNAAWSLMTMPEMELAISHDGLAAVHDRYRRFADGHGSSRIVLATMHMLLAEHAFAVVGVIVLTYHLCFDVSVIISQSMMPALRGSDPEHGEVVLTEKLSYRLREPRRWEVVGFRNDLDMRVMKRVVGLPGEAVALRRGRAVVDGWALRPPPSLHYLNYLAYGNCTRGRTTSCGDGYFVLGDHSIDSQDSRFEGPLPPDRIMGRAWLVIWPLTSVRFVGP